MPYIDPMNLRRGVDLNTSVLSEDQGSLYETNPNNAQLYGKSIKITIPLHQV